MTNETIEHKMGKAIIDYLKSIGVTDFENYAIQLSAEHKDKVQELGSFTFKDAVTVADVQTEEDPTSKEGMFTKGQREPEVVIHTRNIDEFKYGDADEYGEVDWFDKIVLDDLKAKGYNTSNLDKVDLRKMTTINRLGIEEKTSPVLVETKAAIEAYEEAQRITSARRNISHLSQLPYNLEDQDLSDSTESFKDTLTRLKEAIKKLE